MPSPVLVEHSTAPFVGNQPNARARELPTDAPKTLTYYLMVLCRAVARLFQLPRLPMSDPVNWQCCCCDRSNAWHRPGAVACARSLKYYNIKLFENAAGPMCPEQDSTTTETEATAAITFSRTWPKLTLSPPTNVKRNYNRPNKDESKASGQVDSNQASQLWKRCCIADMDKLKQT